MVFSFSDSSKDVFVGILGVCFYVYQCADLCFCLSHYKAQSESTHQLVWWYNHRNVQTMWSEIFVDKKRRVNSILLFIGYVVELALISRIFFVLVGANPETPIVAAVYSITDLMQYPYQNVFGKLFDDPMILDVMTTVLGCLIYGVVGTVIIFVVDLILDETHYSRRWK